MSTKRRRPFERPQAITLAGRLGEPRRFVQVVAGARQVGKTTLVEQVLGRLHLPSAFVFADEPTLGDAAWLAAQWDCARIVAADAGRAEAGMLTGLQKYAGTAVRQRGSSPKLQVLNTELMTAQSGLTPDEARAECLSRADRPC